MKQICDGMDFIKIENILVWKYGKGNQNESHRRVKI
jgi:hypothetical protein